MVKKILVIFMVVVSALGFAACTDDASNGYEVIIENNSDWSVACVEYYDLSGNKQATASVTDGKASADLEDGAYLVLVKDAPENVDYDLVLLTSTSKTKKITLKNAEKSDIPQCYDRYEFSYGTIVLENGVPQAGLKVMMCMSEDGENGGFCLTPQRTDENGFAQMKVTAMEYQIKILTGGSEPIEEYIHTVSAGRRFFIVDLQSNNI